MGTQPYCPSLSKRKGLKIPSLRDPSGRSCHLAFFSSSGSFETSDLKTSSNIKCSFCWKDRCLYFCWLTLDSGGANDRRSRTGWPVFCDWTLVHNRERNRVETQRRLPMQKATCTSTFPTNKPCMSSSCTVRQFDKCLGQQRSAPLMPGNC